MNENQENSMDEVTDLGSPLFNGDDDAHGGPSDGPHFDQLQAIQESSPSQRDMHGAAPDGSYDGYSEARWAGHDLTPAPATAGGNAVAYRLMTTQGLETYDESVAEREDVTDRTTSDSGKEEEGRYLPDTREGLSAGDPLPVVSTDDPSGPEGGDFSKDPQAAVNFWGVLHERDEDGNVTKVVAETEAQDVPADDPEGVVDGGEDGDDFDPAEEQGDGESMDEFGQGGEEAEEVSYPTDAPSGATDGAVTYEEGGDRAEHGSDLEGDTEPREADIVDESAARAGDDNPVV